MTPTACSPRPWLVFADDWGRHPSSCQHLVSKVLPTRPVVWVNTIGTRPLRLDWGTAKRAAGKLKGWVGFGRPTPAPSLGGKGGEAASSFLPSEGGGGGGRLLAPNPRVLSPKMWPSFRSRFGRSLNRRLLLRALKPVAAGLSEPPVVVTTLPLVADLIGELPATRWVYYSVDDFSVWPGYDGETMLRMERDLVPKADVVVAVSETLQRHVADLGKPSHLLTHGVDLDHWKAEPVAAPVPEFTGLTPPVVLFWGVIDRRMDMAFVTHLANHLTAGTVVLVGPREDPDPALLKLPRVVVRPPVPFARLPELAAAASVLVMPYADIPATRAMQPLKLKEYIATGRPAVVRDLPATREWADAVDVSDTPEAFTAAVNARITTGTPVSQQHSRRRIEQEGWAEKARQFESWVNGPE